MLLIQRKVGSAMGPVPVPTLGDLVQAVELLTSALDTVKGKLFRQTGEARDRLGVVLVDLENTYSALNSELSRYLGVIFDPTAPLYDPANARQREKLLDLEGGTIRARVEVVRVRCSEIQQIYWDNLRRWFADLLQPDEAARLEKAFDALGSFDVTLTTGITSLAEWIATHATEVLELVDAGQLAEANDELKQQHTAVRPLRSQLTDIVLTLQRLSAEAMGQAE
jgi:hypothetical protein